MSSRDFMQHLIDIGVIPKAPYEKVIIEADIKSQVRIYTKQYGSPALLNVKFTEDPLTIHINKME